MPGIGNNLYPPIINTWMPAFIRTSVCRLYFSLSIYNNLDDITNAQVIVNNQFDNKSALDATKYPTGIKICSIGVNDEIETDEKYYIDIDPNDLTSKVFELNHFYKVQIRFTGKEAAQLPSQTQIASWLVDNQKYFSEWSTVCLIKGIEQPHIYLKGFDNVDENYQLTFAIEVLDLIGQLYYENTDLEEEALKSYKVLLYNARNEIVYDSGDVYTNVYNPNEINYKVKMNLDDGTMYKLVFTYSTTNEYTETIEYEFLVLKNSTDALNATVEAIPDVEYGRMIINIKSIIGEIFFGNLTIRRASSETNFTLWEDIHQEPITEGRPLDYTWYDYTVESGVWYRYGAQRRNTRGDRGKLSFTDKPVLISLDDMFLNRANMQFRVRFDPTIASFKYNYSEAKVDTLGSRYPYFNRNGNIKYRSFPIGGLVTAFCDDQGVFLNKDNIYNQAKSDYEKYNKEQNITIYRDYIYEREFREKIMDFLYADDIKLFRSPTEGNILVRLMDIVFTPNQVLGRLVYSFTANAYEVDECSIDNYNKYNIQPVGEYKSDLLYRYGKLGQLNGTYKGNDMYNELVSILREQYKNSGATNTIVTLISIKWLRINFISDPYLIQTREDGTPEKYEGDFNEDIIEGYIVFVNGKPMIVSQRGFIEFMDDETEITSVYFPYETEVTFDYIVTLEEREDTSLFFNKMYFYIRAGQMHDVFKPNDDIFNQIYSRYLIQYTTSKQELLSIDRLSVEANPGTVLQIKDSFDNEYFDHEVGGTGVLKFYDDEAVITGIKTSGIHLYLIKDDTEPQEDNYFETGVSVDDITEIEQPQEHGVYTVNDMRMIYYNGAYYEFTKDDIVKCPVEMTIDYVYEKTKGEYQT